MNIDETDLNYTYYIIQGYNPSTKNCRYLGCYRNWFDDRVKAKQFPDSKVARRRMNQLKNQKGMSHLKFLKVIEVTHSEKPV